MGIYFLADTNIFCSLQYKCGTIEKIPYLSLCDKKKKTTFAFLLDNYINNRH